MLLGIRKRADFPHLLSSPQSTVKLQAALMTLGDCRSKRTCWVWTGLEGTFLDPGWLQAHPPIPRAVPGACHTPDPCAGRGDTVSEWGQSWGAGQGAGCRERPEGAVRSPRGGCEKSQRGQRTLPGGGGNSSGGFELLTRLRSFPGVLTQHPPSGASLPCIH